MLAFQAMGVPTVDHGNNIRQVAFDAGVAKAFDFPGFLPAYVRPLFCAWKLVASLRGQRRRGSRFAQEHALIERWLAAVEHGTPAGRALDDTLAAHGAPRRPLREQPVRWFRRRPVD